MPAHLTLEDVIAIHERIMHDMGSRYSALRDAPALEAALVRPQMAAHYEEADLVLQAAYLMAGIVFAHAFVDGNKRVAMAGGLIFLLLNGQRYAGGSLDLAKQIERLIAREDRHQVGIEDLAAWMRSRVHPTGSRGGETKW
jgi:death-on-curing protein